MADTEHATPQHFGRFNGIANISIQLVVMAAIAWQLSRIAGRSPKQALPMAIMLLVGGIGLAVLAWMFFFGAPIVMSFLAVVCSAVVVILSVMARKN
jgi:hypothetical protein